MTLESFSAAETKKIGSDLAARIHREGPGDSAAVVALFGELGAGKTTFVQGFWRGLGLRGRPTSPTFVLMRRTPLTGEFRNVYHIDAYRVSSWDFVAFGFERIVSDPRNIILVEWADRIRDLLPRSTRWVDLAHGPQGPDHRIIHI